MAQLQTNNIRVGDLLVEAGYITDAQLGQALELQKQDRSKRIGQILRDLGFITEDQLLTALARRLGLQIIDLDSYYVNADAVDKLPRALAEKHSIMAVDMADVTLTVVTSDPLNFFAVEEARQTSNMDVELVLAPKEDIDRAIEYYYAEADAKRAARVANAGVEPIAEVIDEAAAGDGDAPVVKLLNTLLIRGYSTNASDIHIEPFERETVVRMRVDGSIVPYVTLQTSLHQPLIARIKILANMDIAERRAPQDGHFRLKLDGVDMNLRVSMIPTVYGEKAVLRYLVTNTPIDNMTSFGMSRENYQKFMGILNSPHGIIYLTGPTGSGKTTTLYMILEYMARKAINISTIEDPVEKNLPGINQMQVNPLAGLTFESGLRALLRQDPDVMMVGETRDSETAAISIRAAITGHLVFSTLHTNDAISSIVRLEDMGQQSYMVANSLVGLVAQRLMRKVCPNCAEKYEADETEKRTLGVPSDQKLMLSRGKGCHMCNNTGYKGRIAVHEIVVIDKEIRSMISSGRTVDEIELYAREKQGMKTLGESAYTLVTAGVTTVDEYMKLTYYSR